MNNIRKQAAEHARDIRSMFATLQGGWTRKQWNDQVRHAINSYVKNMVRFHRVNK